MKKTIQNFPKLAILALFIFACFLSGCLKMDPVAPSKKSSSSTSSGSNNLPPANTGGSNTTGNTGNGTGGTGSGPSYAQFYIDPNDPYVKDFTAQVEVNNHTYYANKTIGNCPQNISLTPDNEGKIFLKLTATNHNSLDEAMGGTAPVTVKNVYIYASELKPGCNTIEMYWASFGLWMKVRQ